MAGFDHFAIACQDLAEGVDYVEGLTGVRAALGGPHPGVGTHNALLSLGTDIYLEIIAKDPDQPEPSAPRPFGIDENPEPRLAAFAIHPGPGETIESLSDLIRSHGFDPGPVVSMSRRKPDGEEISWRLTRAGASGLVPFVIDWGMTPNPATITPTGCSLLSVEGRTASPDSIVGLHSDLSLNSEISAGSAHFAIVLDTPAGTVTIT
jgi:hypothetical protein|tara:strand:+ start:140 stop:760 length:621 start_codon:yes stop_codon:yes gene_type:complete